MFAVIVVQGYYNKMFAVIVAQGYYNKRQLCDVVLVVGSKRIAAHRVLLSAASDYFSAMFTSDVSEAGQEEIKLYDVDPDAMEMLVQYMYNGT